MLKKNPNGNVPQIHKSVYIDPTAVIIGKVRIRKNVFIGPCAIIRADESNSFISISDNCNIQDGVIIHALENTSVLIGKNTSIAHGSIVHGPCTIGKNCFVGFNTVVYKSKINDGVVVKHLAIVENVHIPKGKLIPTGAVVDSKSKVINLENANLEMKAFSNQVVKVNLELRKGYYRNLDVWR